MIAFLLIYSRFYFCFAPLNSERIITPLPVTELWSLTDLSLHPGFPTHALRIYRQFTWPLWDLVTSNWELNEKNTAWHRIKAQCVVSAAAVFVLLFFVVIPALHIFSEKVSWARQLMLFQILRHVTLTCCNQSSEKWNGNHWNFVYSLCRKETNERKQADSVLVKRGTCRVIPGVRKHSDEHLRSRALARGLETYHTIKSSPSNCACQGRQVDKCISQRFPVIPSWNRKDHLVNCLSSLAHLPCPQHSGRFTALWPVWASLHCRREADGWELALPLPPAWDGAFAFLCCVSEATKYVRSPGSGVRHIGALSLIPPFQLCDFGQVATPLWASVPSFTWWWFFTIPKRSFWGPNELGKG